jgi:hypothetical protein
MRSRGVPWVLACAFGNGTRRRCGENGTAEDPGTIRQRVECLDLTRFRRNPECFRCHLKKPLGCSQVAAKDNTARPLNCLMNANPQAGPSMPRIQQLPKLGTMGVLKPCCTTQRGRIPRSATRRRRSTPNISPQPAITLHHPKALRAGRLLTPRQTSVTGQCQQTVVRPISIEISLPHVQIVFVILSNRLLFDIREWISVNGHPR